MRMNPPTPPPPPPPTPPPPRPAPPPPAAAAAVLLAREGRRVTVLERDDIGSGETGNTTSHLTEAVDARYSHLTKTFGEAAAEQVAHSSRDAIDRIEGFVREAGAECGFSRVP